MSDVPSTSFLARHEFLLRRLHSLSGVIPVGAYMCVHLGTNSLTFFSNETGMFQRAVDQIHALGPLLPVVEWLFIFLPLLFHGIYGVIIVRSGQSNSAAYRYGSNVRYTLQRLTGMVALLFIVWHVFHMHGWFHFPAWVTMAKGLGGAQFAPFNAASSGAAAMQMNPIVPILYAIGVGSCIYHLANGLWTFGITWGIWVSPEAQKKALVASAAFGGLLTVVGFMAWTGFAFSIDKDKAYAWEKKHLEERISAGEVDPAEAEHKSSHPDEKSHGKSEAQEVTQADAESSGS